MPTRAYDAPPGLFMLFVIDDAGVPSEARIVRVNVAHPNPAPATLPLLQQPANQSGLAGVSVSLQLHATDPNGDALTYSAAGLPPGLSIDAATGIIGGTPLSAGNYAVVAVVGDGVNATSRSFSWNVTGNVPIAVTLSP